ncbi:MAG TPA: methyltransferase domain-containing protein [Pirellulales bacterium]|nr:methyltransferase domain-containing protein [Pirellulales bacterium]
MLGYRMQTHFNLTPAEYEARREGAVEERRRSLVRSEMNGLHGVTHALELGCGPGRFLDELAGDYPQVHFTGIDVCPAMIDYARRQHRRANLQYECRDIIESADGDAAQFVFSIDVLHHVHRLAEFFAAIRRLMSPGGRWLAIEPNVYHPYIYYSQERMRRAGFDEDHFRPWQAEPLLNRAGFQVVSRNYASVFPGTIRRLPRPLSWLERRCENWRLLGGSVVYRLVVEKMTNESAQ